MNIYVANIPFKASEPELKGLFEEYGEVSSVKIITDKFNGKSKGFGFVEMNNADEAKRAIEQLNGGELDGRKMVVNEARPRREGGGDSRGGGKRF